MSDKIIAVLRTGVPALWGLVWAWLLGLLPFVGEAVGWLSDTVGEDVSTVIEGAVTAGVIAAYYWLARALVSWLQGWAPDIASPVERLLLGYPASPTYGTLTATELEANRQAEQARAERLATADGRDVVTDG